MGGGKHPPKGSISLKGVVTLGTAPSVGRRNDGSDPAPDPSEHADGGFDAPELPPEVAAVPQNGLAPPPVPEDADPSLKGGNKRLRYECRKCRTPLFTTDVVVGHSDADDARGHKGFLGKKYHQQKLTSDCSSLFLDPSVTEWVGEQSSVGGNSGDLVCPVPKCGAKIGSWSWIGSQCSCGQWVNPSFKVLASRLDAFEEDGAEEAAEPIATDVAVEQAIAA
jgi:dual specificity phosphatase 12